MKKQDLTALYQCLAPAKLNLFLHVTGQRADGYHELETLFQLLDYGDSLDFVLRADEKICRVTDLAGVAEEDDLVIRAAHILKQAAFERLGKVVCGVDISLEKRLPFGGGVGGGSSDAATTLMALNVLWQTYFSQDILMTLGLALGADVPFFIYGRNAFAQGVGEVLQPVETPECWYVVVEPGVEIPTAKIFTSKRLTRDTESVKITDFPSDVLNLMRFGGNDLQHVACQLYPEVLDAIAWLSRYGYARMTGSGASVFSAFLNEHEADDVLKHAPKTWRAWKAKSLSQHPMHVIANKYWS